jgi:MFS family permease
MQTIQRPNAGPAAPRSQSRLGPFRHAPFSVYWAGGMFSNIGTWLQAVAGSIFVYQLTGSEFDVGLLNFMSFIPIFLFSAVGGVLSDRYDRRALVAVTSVIAGIFAAILGLLTFAGQATAIHVMITAFAINTAYAFAKPALASQLPDLVPGDDLTDAVGLNSLQFIGGQLIGPVIAAAVIATAGAGWAFTINALTFVGPVLAMLYLYRKGLAGGTAAARKVKGYVAPARIGAIAYLRAQPWVLSMLLAVFSTSAALEFIRTLSPALAVQAFGEPESVAGLIVAAQSAGSAVGLLLFVPLRRRGLMRPMQVGGYLLQASGLLIVALVGSLPAALLAVSMIGLGFAFAFPIATGVLQAEVPDAMRGRVMSYHTMFHLGNRPFAALAAGTLATLVGAHSAVLGGVVLAPLGLIVARHGWRQLAELRSRSAPDPDPDLAVAAAR